MEFQFDFVLDLFHFVFGGCLCLTLFLDVFDFVLDFVLTVLDFV